MSSLLTKEPYKLYLLIERWLKINKNKNIPTDLIKLCKSFIWDGKDIFKVKNRLIMGVYVSKEKEFQIGKSISGFTYMSCVSIINEIDNIFEWKFDMSHKFSADEEISFGIKNVDDRNHLLEIMDDRYYITLHSKYPKKNRYIITILLNIKKKYVQFKVNDRLIKISKLFGIYHKYSAYIIADNIQNTASISII